MLLGLAKKLPAPNFDECLTPLGPFKGGNLGYEGILRKILFLHPER